MAERKSARTEKIQDQDPKPGRRFWARTRSVMAPQVQRQPVERRHLGMEQRHGGQHSACVTFTAISKSVSVRWGKERYTSGAVLAASRSLVSR
jgi:hypothetical protein